MDTSTLEPALDDFERRVKPKVEDAALGEEAESFPETPSTHNKHSNSTLEETLTQSPIFQSAGILNIMPCQSHEHKSDAPPSAAPCGDAPPDSTSLGCLVHSALSVPSISITTEVGGGDVCQQLGDHNSNVPPSLTPANSIFTCSGGTFGHCHSPHLPVKTRGMCRTCYSRDYYHRVKVSGPVFPKTPKSEVKQRPANDPMILYDDFGAPILDKFGVPIQVYSPTHHPLRIQIHY
jgi:hypothetical protein